MATQVLKIGTLESTITFALTNAQVASAIEYFIANTSAPMPKEMTVAQGNQWKLDEANAKLRDYFRREAKQNRRKMLAEAQASLDAQAFAETAL